MAAKGRFGSGGKFGSNPNLLFIFSFYLCFPNLIIKFGTNLNLTHVKVIFGIYGIKDLWVMGRSFLMWGRQGILVLHHILHSNHRFYIQPRVLGMCHHLSPRYKKLQSNGNQILVLWLQEMRCKNYNGYCKIILVVLPLV